MKQKFERILLILVIIFSASETSASIESENSDSLILKMAVINESGVKTTDDILGWIYIYQKGNGSCYRYSEAQPPHIGIIDPINVSCPVGLQAIELYKIDFSEAVGIMHENINDSDIITEISLYWPVSQDIEPQWHIKNTTGVEFVVGANTGEFAELQATRLGPAVLAPFVPLIPYAACFYGCAAGCMWDDYPEACMSQCGDECKEEWVPL